MKISDIQKLKSFEKRAGGFLYETNCPIFESIKTTIQKRRLKWVRHVLNMPPHRLGKACLEFVKRESWKRPPGSIKTTWMRQVVKELEPHLNPYKHTKKNGLQNGWDYVKKHRSPESKGKP